MGLYQHVGATRGGDYWTIHGPFVSDSHAGVRHDDPDASFDGASAVVLTPMIHDGNGYQPGTSSRIAVPFEGDAVLSPSAQLVVTRVAGPRDDQLGYVMRRVDAKPTGTGYDVALPEIARYCVSGGKPALSYDERWMVYHHTLDDADATDLGFRDESDPGFAPYRSQGASNIYLLELATGKVTRVTRMNPGQYAYYPHFRSDGWLYFIVRTVRERSEHVVASDAALLLEP